MYCGDRFVDVGPEEIEGHCCHKAHAHELDVLRRRLSFGKVFLVLAHELSVSVDSGELLSYSCQDSRQDYSRDVSECRGRYHPRHYLAGAFKVQSFGVHAREGYDSCSHSASHNRKSD